MSYHIYTTDALILKTAPAGERDLSLLVFTKDFGMLSVRARGIRMMQSRLRATLQELSFVRLSLVRGKGVWRVTSAQLVDAFFRKVLRRSDIQKVFGNIVSLLHRLSPEAEENHTLYIVLHHGIHQLCSVPEDRLVFVEYITVLRMLRCLGYVGDTKTLQRVYGSMPIDQEVLQEVENKKQLIIQTINESLAATQL